jgi:hypothetical protein
VSVTQAIYDVLVNDPDIIGSAGVGTYRASPAIYTIDPAPGNAFPYIIAAGDVSHIPSDTKTSYGREIQRDIRCYDRALGSAARVEALAERVRSLFHNQLVQVPGFTNVLSSVPSGPFVADGEGVYGRVVTVRLLLEE